MDANEYQELAARTLIDKPGFAITDDEWRLIWGAIRLSAYAGAVAENVKKGVFHRHGVNRAMLLSDLMHLIEASCAMYQQKGYAGLPLNDTEVMQIWNLIGLVGEAGEVARSFGEVYFSGDAALDSASLAKELGDVMWYVAALCTKSELELGTVLEQNIEKLKRRYPHGFTAADSKNRVDVKTPDPRREE